MQYFGDIVSTSAILKLVSNTSGFVKVVMSASLSSFDIFRASYTLRRDEMRLKWLTMSYLPSWDYSTSFACFLEVLAFVVEIEMLTAGSTVVMTGTSLALGLSE